MNFNELIQDGILIQKGSRKRREYLLNLDLKISEQKIQRLNHVRWNEEMSHQLHLPAAWFDYIEQGDNPSISSAYINTKLKKWLDNQFVGSTADMMDEFGDAYEAQEAREKIVNGTDSTV
jgi:hypothetical protein